MKSQGMPRRFGYIYILRLTLELRLRKRWRFLPDKGENVSGVAHSQSGHDGGGFQFKGTTDDGVLSIQTAQVCSALFPGMSYARGVCPVLLFQLCVSAPSTVFTMTPRSADVCCIHCKSIPSCILS